MLDAVVPIVVLIVLIATTIAIFGTGATEGPLQIALFLSAAFASLVAFKNGHTVASVADAAVGGVTTAMGAIFILLAVGALMGTWNMAGTIPTVVHLGIGWLTPTLFFVMTAAICALVGMVTGSSWTTAGTLGVAFIGMAKVLGLSEAVAAGAIISGAYFGDKMTPLSETTILVPSLVGRGLTTSQHIRSMWWTAAPALGISPWVAGFVVLVASNVWVLPYQGLEYLIARDATQGEDFDDRQGTQVGAALTVIRLVAIAVAVPVWQAMGLVAR
jgi:NhaC family Na+:H+ antiporter